MIDSSVEVLCHADTRSLILNSYLLTGRCSY